MTMHRRKHGHSQDQQHPARQMALFLFMISKGGATITDSHGTHYDPAIFKDRRAALLAFPAEHDPAKIAAFGPKAPNICLKHMTSIPADELQTFLGLTDRDVDFLTEYYRLTDRKPPTARRLFPKRHFEHLHRSTPNVPKDYTVTAALDIPEDIDFAIATSDTDEPHTIAKPASFAELQALPDCALIDLNTCKAFVLGQGDPAAGKRILFAIEHQYGDQVTEPDHIYCTAALLREHLAKRHDRP